MRRHLIRVLPAGLIAAVLSACASSPYSPSGANADRSADSAAAGSEAVSCGSLFDTVMSRERAGDTAGAINAELDELGDRCPARYQVFVDYVSIKGFADIGAGGPCAEYADYDVKSEAIRLARQDGYCSGGGQVNESAGTADWSCSYSPTYNNDWHDDVVCSNGVDQERPYLRGWDSFVTEAEIMESAREYEAQLNGG